MEVNSVAAAWSGDEFTLEPCDCGVEKFPEKYWILEMFPNPEVSPSI
jgi:hypothetical protein